MTTQSILQHLRRAHALEHATIHVLTQRHPGRTFAGRSNQHGFTIIGAVTADELRSAVSRALERLQNGEKELAYHPNCGTNLVVGGLFSGAAAFLTTLSFRETSWKKRLEQFPTVVSIATLALIAAQPLAALAQKRLTTNPDMGDLWIERIDRIPFGSLCAHRVSLDHRNEQS
ncbi:MAG: hypothetical protein JXA97_03260 [Anaerolineales bacterium]|nr:hypothetical protein [Anaerolineales bacterium]